jgi:hypothetical protein
MSFHFYWASLTVVEALPVSNVLLVEKFHI